jgi:hypothetical protein
MALNRHQPLTCNKEGDKVACEKCWNDAYWRARGDGRSQADHYFELLQERKNMPCGPEYETENYFCEGELGNPVEEP